MLNVNRLAEALLCRSVGNRQRRPVPLLVLVVGIKINLIPVLIGIDLKQIFVVVVFAVNESQEIRARIGTENLLQNARLHIVPQFVPSCILVVLQKPGVASAGCRWSRFFDLVIGRIRKAQDQVLEPFTEFIFLGEQLQRSALGGLWRVKDQRAISDKDCAG